jgi:hypothetical protein
MRILCVHCYCRSHAYTVCSLLLQVSCVYCVFVVTAGDMRTLCVHCYCRRHAYTVFIVTAGDMRILCVHCYCRWHAYTVFIVTTGGTYIFNQVRTSKFYFGERNDLNL